MNHSPRKSTVLLRLLMVATLLLPLCFSYRHSSAQSGVLIPSTSSKPDPNTLSLQVMNVDVLIDNQHARVRVMQIFDSHSSQILEGKYLFALPQTASIWRRRWAGAAPLPALRRGGASRPRPKRLRRPSRRRIAEPDEPGDHLELCRRPLWKR